MKPEDSVTKSGKIVYRDDQSILTINDNITRFAGGNLRQSACGRFVNGLCASLQFGRKNMHRARSINFRDVFDETKQLHVIGKILQQRFDLLMGITSQP